MQFSREVSFLHPTPTSFPKNGDEWPSVSPLGKSEGVRKEKNKMALISISLWEE